MKKIVLALMLSITSVSATLPLTLPIATAHAAAMTELGDLSPLSVIARASLKAVQSSDMAGAEKQITDFETVWDQAAGDMQPKNPDTWHVIDMAADKAIEALRTGTPNKEEATLALSELIAALNDPSVHATTAIAIPSNKFVITNTDGSPLPCEVALKNLRDIAPTRTVTDQAQYDALMKKGLERCNADDDKRADGFFADAFSLLK